MLRSIALSSYATNCYILTDDETGDALAVDCAAFSDAYRGLLRDCGCALTQDPAAADILIIKQIKLRLVRLTLMLL